MPARFAAHAKKTKANRNLFLRNDDYLLYTRTEVIVYTRYPEVVLVEQCCCRVVPIFLNNKVPTKTKKMMIANNSNNKRRRSRCCYYIKKYDRIPCFLLIIMIAAMPISTRYNNIQHCNAFTLSSSYIPKKTISTSKRRRNHNHNARMTLPTFMNRQSQQQNKDNHNDDSSRRQTTRLHMAWDGDDMRWTSRLWRRYIRSRGNSASDSRTPIRTSIFAFQIFMFVYQIITTVNFIRIGHPSYWPKHALSMIGDALLGTSINGPLTRDFAFSCALSYNQPHRFVTSGFIHSGIFHLLINMDTLQRQPSWIETGLGGGLYLTTFLLSIVVGNLGHMYAMDSPFDTKFVLGCSGGICGLYGLMYISLVKMGNGRAARSIVRGMLTMILLGSFFDKISSPSHIGGFLCGIVLGILCGPKSYQKDYRARRKNSVQYDNSPRDFRQAMGFGNMPSNQRWIPLPVLWGAILIALIASGRSQFHSMPELVLKGFLFPGSLI